MSPTNQERLHSVVVSNSTDQRLISEFKHFHLSVKQKLWSVNHFYEQIKQLRPEQHYSPTPESPYIVVKQSPDREQFGLYANLLLDGFLITSMSTLDTLAHEITVLYTFKSLPRNLYITSVKHLRRDHPSSYITHYLVTEINRLWFKTFSKYRNFTTHESLIGANIHIEADLITGDLLKAYVPLPDDPKHTPFRYTRNRALRPYCKSIKNHINEMIRHSYMCIIQDIKTSKNILPIT